jgi:hypothetical protein
MEYLCETTSLEGFVQLLACNFLPHGYWFYVTGRIPHGKDCRRIDAKLIEKYGVSLSRAARCRRKQLGYANLRYLRWGRFFVLIATHGKHRFFEEEGESVRDIRRVPLKIAGYSISFRPGNKQRSGKADEKGHSHIAIGLEQFKELQAWFAEIAARQSTARLGLEFYRFPYEPYAPIRRQMLRLLRIVNEVRKRKGFDTLPYEVLPLRRRVVKPFGLLQKLPVKQKENKIIPNEGGDNPP